MTKTDIINRLKVDPYYALGFALDNNFPAIRTKLAEKGFMVQTYDEAWDKIIALVQMGRAQDIRDIFNVPYLDWMENGTGGFSDFFIANSPAPTNPANTQTRDATIWTGVLSFLAGGLTGLNANLSGSGTGTSTTADQQAAAAAEAKAKALKTGLIILGSAVGLGLLIWGISVLVKKSRKKAAA